MCGIAGLWSSPVAPSGSGGLDAVVRAMTGALAHRGPDGDGHWIDDEAGIALGHRRLAILDLTETGRQPMRSSSGRYVIVFNGEIYNFRRLRPELERQGCAFRGNSDTEVLLAAIQQWGIETALERCIGMFAFALWDREQRELTLARDRVGKKPLYYGVGRPGVLFASELKAFTAVPGMQLQVDRHAVARFLRYGYVPGPASIFAGFGKVHPGSIVRIRSGLGGRFETREHTYWRPAEATPRRADISLAQASAELEELLTDAVSLRLESDVPLGAFLSGGIDSTVVVALMQRLAAVPVRTFTIGFRESGYDEAQHARAVAARLGTDHTELYLEPRDVLAVVPEMAQVYDEPFADSSQLPTVLLAQLARRHVTVALSGDGGDEVFGGYRRYQRFARLWRLLSRIPGSARATTSATLARVSGLGIEPLWSLLAKAFPGDVGSVPPRQQLAKLSALLQLPGMDALYERQLAHWDDPAALVAGANAPWWTPAGDDPGDSATLPQCFERMMALDLGFYLPDDILVKVDRATMHVGLEARSPLLDHRVIEFAAGLPLEHRVRQGAGKIVLRDLAYRLVPRELLERPKQGFAVPLAQWLRGPLRDWAADLLDRRSMTDAGLVAPGPVERCWREHLEGRRDWSVQLWDVLMLHSWHRAFVATRAWSRAA